MVQLNELLNLALVIVLGPLIVLNRRGVLRNPSDTCFAWGICLMAGAYVVTVLEGFLLPEALNLLEHALLAAAGISFVVGLVRSETSTRRREASS